MNLNVHHILVEKDITHLSLCVLPSDHFAPEIYPVGAIRTYLKKEKISGVMNISGYYTFLNLEDGNYTVRIETEFYLTKEFVVIVPSYGSPPGGAIYSDDEDVHLRDYNGVLVATVTLRPNSTYPFPGGSNLIRGIVYDATMNPVPNAVVSVLGKPIHNKTTERGEFVLYFTGLTVDNVIRIDGRKFVRGNGTQEIKIEADHPDFGVSPQFSLQLKEGTIASASIVYP